MSLLYGGAADMMLGRGRGSYANPHSTIAARDIPTNIKQVMRLCRYYYHTDSLLRALVDKMSEYPITDLLLDDIEGEPEVDERTYDKWDRLLNIHLNVPSVLKGINVDTMVYGTSIHYLNYPFVRYAQAQSQSIPAVPLRAVKNVKIIPKMENGKFTFYVEGTVAIDGFRHKHTFRIYDRKSEAGQGLRLARLNPIRVKLDYNVISGERQWSWTPPAQFREGLITANPVIYLSTEMKILEAAYNQQDIILNQDRLWIAQADTMPGIWEGWGVPPLFPVLEDVYYYRILRRANEALAQEHVTPFRIMSPSGTGDVSPQRSLNMTDWQNRVRTEMARFRRDPNHVMISPIPINIEQMGGQARVMMVAAEMEAAARIIAAGVGCPLELIWGGLNWSGASVSLRVLENHFLNVRKGNERLVNFLVPKLAQHYRMPRISVKMAEFKMADDVQQQGNAINLMLQGFLSRRSVINKIGYQSDQEFDQLEQEHGRLNSITMKDNIAAAHMNTVVQALQAQAQVLLQYEMSIMQKSIEAKIQRQRLSDLAAFAADLHRQGLASPIELEQSSMMLGRMDPSVRDFILREWTTSMPLVTRMLMAKIQAGSSPVDDMGGPGMGGMAGAGPAIGAAPQPLSPGAAGGAGLAPGAVGPYAQAGLNEAPPMDGGQDQALPDQRPPRRASSSV
jgi:hypothetical protein